MLILENKKLELDFERKNYKIKLLVLERLEGYLMFGYFICIGAVVVLVLLAKQTITKDGVAVLGAIAISMLVIRVFRSELDKKYYHEKTYLWSLVLGTILVLTFYVIMALACINYVEFKLYHLVIFSIGGPLMTYGRKRLAFLKLEADKGNEELIAEHKKLSSNLIKSFLIPGVTIAAYLLAYCF